ncbi:DUF2603 domain-containing protein [Helicobacter burdigaliensis]|uniref:DUF2603 domain-containing protein n=1 Tax=Helicobacter burdigaliensis TaxID=2315334 RepID=UPI000EF6736A|nr:DUF2603 domain-containing protein [Helicobacter burdigaliensis]
MATSKSLKNIHKNPYVDLTRELKIAKKNPKEAKAVLKKTLIDHLEDKIYCLNHEGEEYYLLPKKLLNSFAEATKELERQKILFSLEQEIYKNMPIDFDDVWCIALKELQSNFKKNPKELIKRIKKHHPYLFFDYRLKNLPNPSL